MRVEANNNQGSLLLSMAALRAQTSSLNLRCKQAEEMVQTLLQEKFTKEELADMVFDRLVLHMNARDVERSAQYQAVIQTTLLALDPVARQAEGAVKEQIVEVIKNLTMVTK